MKKQVKCNELFDCKTDYLKTIFENSEYIQEILPDFSNRIKMLIKDGIKGYKLVAEGILVGENVKIYSTAILEPPVILGSNTVVKPGVYINDGFICGENCTIGSSSEIKNSLFLNNVSISHNNYIYSSVIGDFVNIGAGSVLNPETFIGEKTTVYPQALLNGIFPCSAVIKSQNEIIKIP